MSEELFESDLNDFEMKALKKNVVQLKPFKEEEQNNNNNEEVESYADSEDSSVLMTKNKSSDLKSVINDLSSQIVMLSRKLECEDVTPEFKALMDGYIKKANESEELKVKLENLTYSCEIVKADLIQLRDLNRNLSGELQLAREAIRNFETQINMLQMANDEREKLHKEKVKEITKKSQDYEDKISELEQNKSEIKNQTEKRIVELIKTQENLKQEISDMDFDFRQRERDLINEIDNLNKQVKEFERLNREQQEKIELKTKEAEYKATLLNQMAKNMSKDKEEDFDTNISPVLNSYFEEHKIKRKNKKKFWGI